jgi:nucleotidyltransferase substrate binding protein (TIGR01987 family)
MRHDMSESRWHQRFKNFSGAVALLSEAVALVENDKASMLEREGTIQRFEYCWELAWKTLRDLLVEQGMQLSARTPANVIRAAHEAGLVSDGDLWIEAMRARNRMSHEYSREAFAATINAISSRYLPMLLALNERLDHELDA